MGSALFALGDHIGGLWSVRLPFIITSAFTLLFIPCILLLPPMTPSATPSTTDKKESWAICDALKFQVLLSCFSIAMNGTIVATLDPTLSWRLQSEPFNLDSVTVGLFFMMASFSYMVASFPIGMLTDKIPEKLPQRGWAGFKLLQGVGLLLIGFSFIILGPADFLSLGLQHDVNKMSWVIGSLIIRGLGSAGNNASFPDIVFGTNKDDEVLQANLSGLYNGAFAVGWAVGPVLGGLLTPNHAASFSSYSGIMAVTSFVSGVLVIVGGFATKLPAAPANENLLSRLVSEGYKPSLNEN